MRGRLRPILVAIPADLLVVGLVALAVRVVVAALVAFPVPEDTAYHVEVARNLVTGRGLVSDALWSYATAPLELPRPAFELWRPLPTFLVAVPMALLGTSFRVAQLLPVLAGTATALLAWRLGADLAAESALPPLRARAIALGSGLAAAIALPLLLHAGLPDSTALFGALALGAVLLMGRLVRDGSLGDGSGHHAHGSTGRLVLLGILLGAAALTRTEAVWLGLAWVVVAWGPAGPAVRGRLRAIGLPGLVALAVVLPWALRDLAVFGSPLPGQAALNALSLRPEDVFAWSDPPTLARYLAAGPGTLLAQRAEGLRHDLLDVLLVPGAPLAPLGLLVLLLPVGGLRRSRVLRPLLLFAVATFLVASLLLPVATTWGTFLHAAVPVHVLLLVAAVRGLDATVTRLAAARRWGAASVRLVPLLAVLLAATLAPGVAVVRAESDATAARYAALATALPAAGVPVGPTAAPVVTDHPVWHAEALRSPALALPAERAAAVLDLARTFGASTVLLTDPERSAAWKAALGAATAAGDPAAACFAPIPLGTGSGLGGVSAWRIDCP